MNASASYRLADGVAMRPERFGALVYRYDNRRLYFIHSRQVADFLAGLDGHCSLDQAAAAFLERNRLPSSAGETLFRTVESLERIGLVSATLPR